jgi:hypothetical protein
LLAALLASSGARAPAAAAPYTAAAGSGDGGYSAKSGYVESSGCVLRSTPCVTLCYPSQYSVLLTKSELWVAVLYFAAMYVVLRCAVAFYYTVPYSDALCCAVLHCVMLRRYPHRARDSDSEYQGRYDEGRWERRPESSIPPYDRRDSHEDERERYCAFVLIDGVVEWSAV